MPHEPADLSGINPNLRGVIHRDRLGVVDAPMRKFCEFDDRITLDLADLVRAIEIIDYVQRKSHKDVETSVDELWTPFE